MKKTLDVECCELCSSISDRYNLHEKNHPARIIYDPDLASKRLEEAQRAFEAKQAEVRAQNAEIQERNKAAEAEVKRKTEEDKWIGLGITILTFMVSVVAFGLFLNVALGIFQNEARGWLIAIIASVVASVIVEREYYKHFEKIVFVPDKYIEISESIKDFYTIHEDFMEWWKEDFSVLKIRFSYSSYYRKYTIFLEVADDKDEVHMGTFEIPEKNAPPFIVKRNHDGIEFDLINNRIVVPYVAS